MKYKGSDKERIVKTKLSFLDLEFPCKEPLGLKGQFIVFQSQSGKNFKPDIFLAQEIEFLSALNPGECYYGAGSFPIFPFICELPIVNESLRGVDILTALKPHNFRSEHIQNLEATTIPYSGYHPYTENDEIHNDFTGQNIFGREDHEDEFMGVHGELKRFVAKEQLWYTLFHTMPEQNEDHPHSRYVLLFAVGRSPYSNRLVGVVTHQVCHNLCD
jgi:hypothetical protein